MKLRPLHDRVVVERIGPEPKSAGGIIIPDAAQEKPSQGKIIAVGPGRQRQADPDGFENWRPRAVRQVVWN